MSQASLKNTTKSRIIKCIISNIREILILVLLLMTAYLSIALFTYHPDDTGWSYSITTQHTHNTLGATGAYIIDIMLYIFGYFAYLLPILLLVSSWRLYCLCRYKENLNQLLFIYRTIGVVLIFISGCAIAGLHFHTGLYLPHEVRSAGGILGYVFGILFYKSLGGLGSTLLLLAIFITGLTLYTGISWIKLMDYIGYLTLVSIARMRQKIITFNDLSEGYKVKKKREKIFKNEQEIEKERIPPVIESPIIDIGVSSRIIEEKQDYLFEPPPETKLPPLNLLDDTPVRNKGYSNEALEAMSRQVELKLKDFGISVEVVAVHLGPVITRFELNPAAGIKGSRIINLAKDIARSLSVTSVRIIDVIPGKPYIGLEIPNEHRELVTLGEILKSDTYDNMKSVMTIALGKDIGGQTSVTDLSKMPHLLVAGTTGSGKSVALNAMILSLLYKSTSKDVKMIMIDPKMLELSVYDDIPNLLAPVVTDMKEAANSLRWCVAEMERRYKLMAKMSVRNISGYNRKIIDAAEQGEKIPDPFYKPFNEEDEIPYLDTLPFIIVIIDELADMMMTVGKKVEELIARLAQKARAAGIHLILATQRPSVDVITGLIKANVPSRIAFQVSSKIDSRTILDQMGAEHLLGHGDMLFLPAGSSIPERIHGAFVSDNEVHKVVSYLKSLGKPKYVDEILRAPSEGGADAILGVDSPKNEIDPLYDEAVSIVTETRKASISYIQRRLRIGYNRAARIIEEMESSGVVSSIEPNGNREILVAPPPSMD